MISELVELFSLGPEFVALIFLIFARVAAAMSLLPAFGEQVVSVRVKLVLSLGVVAVIAPIIWSSIEQSVQSRNWYGLFLIEALAGLLIGISFRFLIIILQITGSIAAQTISLAQLFGGGVGPEPQPAFSTLFVVAGLCVAVMAGLHVKVCELFVLSYDVFPVGQNISASGVSEWGAERVSHFFAVALTLAAPFVLAAVVYNLALGVINRAMPQLMVAFVGAPAISLAALIMLFAATPLLLMAWLQLASEHYFSPNLGFK